MSIAKVVGLVLAVVMLVGGGFLALTGMGYIGKSGDTSQAWSVLGSLIAGLGVALVITLFQRKH